MQSQRPSAAAQLQQLQQMQAQFRQQQQSSSGSNSGNVSAPSPMMSGSRGMSMTSPNIPQLPPHQMLSSQLGGGGNTQQWQGNGQMGNQQMGMNNMSFPLMANQQLQQQLQSQLLSNQQGGSGGQSGGGQMKNQQAQAALYWNALAASGNNNMKGGQSSNNMSNTSNFPLNTSGMGNMDMLNNSNAMNMLQQQQMNFMGNNNQSMQQFQMNQGQGNQGQTDQQSSLSSNMLSSNPSANQSTESMDFSGMNFNLQGENSTNSTPVPSTSTSNQTFNPTTSTSNQTFNQDMSSQQGQQGPMSSEQMLIQQQKIIAQLQRQIQQLNGSQAPAAAPEVSSPKPMLPQSTRSNETSSKPFPNPNQNMLNGQYQSQNFFNNNMMNNNPFNNSSNVIKNNQFDMLKQQQLMNDNQMFKKPDDTSSATQPSNQLTHQQLFEWQLKNFSMINRLNQQTTGKEKDEKELSSDDESKKKKKKDKSKPKTKKKEEETQDPKQVLSFSDPNSLVQEIPTSQKGLDKSFIGGWQSNADLPDRRRIIVEIVRVIEKMRPDANKMTQKLPLMAKKLEEHLYHSAPTKEDYVDSSTLKKRLQMIAHGLGVRRSSDSVTSPKNQDSSTIPDIPTVPPVVSNPTAKQESENLFPMQQQMQQFNDMNPDTTTSSGNTNLSMQIQQQLNMLKQKQQQLLQGGNENQGLMQQLQQDQRFANDKSDSMVNNLNQLLLQQYQAQNKGDMNDIQKILNKDQNNSGDNLQDSLRKIQQAQGSKLKNEASAESKSTENDDEELTEAQKKEKKAIKQQQYRLILLRHASKCTLGAACKTQFCSQMVPLWKHMKKCRSKSCTVPHCLSSRCVLNHYRMCKSEGRTARCEVCAPVLEQIKWQQKSREQQTNDEKDNDPLLQEGETNENASETNNTNIMNSLLKIKQQSALNTGITTSLPFQPFQQKLENKHVDQMQQQLSQLQQVTQKEESTPQSEAQKEQNIQQKRLILQQLQLQQAQLQEQQKGLMIQQQQVEPNSSQARQLQQQLSLLFQLQQLFQEQQHLVQNELQRLSQSLLSNNEDKEEEEKDNEMDSSRSSRSSTSKSHRKSVLKRSKPDTPSSMNSSRGKCFRKSGKSIKSNMDDNLLPTQTMASLPTFDQFNKRPNDQDNAPPNKKLKVDVPSMDSFKETDKSDTEKNLQQQPGYVESTLNLISSMNLNSIGEHIESLSDIIYLTPAQISEKCLPLIQKLIEDPYGWVFRDPVDPVELGIPDYFEIIKEAMDLSLIKRKLENKEYKCISNFERETKLVFDNSILYNGENSDVGDMAKTLSTFFQKQLKMLMKGIKAEHQVQKKRNDACTLCGTIRRQFEPCVLYCSGSCGMQIIERDATYYADKFNMNNWCSSCYKDLDGSSPLFSSNGVEVNKGDLLKLVNDEVGEEAWIKCDVCSHWVHQVCALYNGPKEKTFAYTCPKCYEDKKKKNPDTVDRWLVPLKRARDLPTCGLSDAMELGLKKRLEAAYFEKNTNSNDLEKVEGLTIRVVSNVAKNTIVRKEMMERYGNLGVARQYPHRSKCIVLFQTIHGADVMLFAMYVHEYGDACAPPNRRRVYISYLDSVHYMQPASYRTMVYQSIIKEYLKSAKLRGFHTAHIWSCPPSNGHDYIFNCHSPKQRVPRPDILSSWYSKLLSDAKSEGVVLDVRSYYDEYLKNDGMFTAAVRPNDPTCLPYFEGDYIPGELENIIMSVKGTNGQDKVLSKLSQSINSMKQYFVVAHLRSRKFANACDRGDPLSNWSEEDEKLLNKVYGKDASVLSDDKKDEELKLDKKDMPKTLTKIGDAIEKDMYNDCEIFHSRHHFLHFCQQKHLQFDELRRAKHSTMIILHQLHKPTAPRFYQQCKVCYREICTGTRYHCNDCINYDLCEDCYEPIINGLWAQRDNRFSHDSTHTFSGVKCETVSDSSYLSQEERSNNVKVHLEILSHSSTCEGRCNSSNCQRMKLLFKHLQTCTKNFKDGCKVCDRYLLLLSIHSRSCDETGACSVPLCSMLRERNQRLNQKQHVVNDRRRIAQNDS